MNIRSVNVRPYTTGDKDRVWDVIREVWREFGARASPEHSPDLGSIEDYYEAGASGFWVAEAGPDIVGTVGLLDAGVQQATLKRMYVLEAFRGVKWGTGYKLLSAALEAARRSGIRAIYLGTPEFTTRAHRFYEKHGFQRLSRPELPPSVVVDPIDTRFYLLNI